MNAEGIFSRIYDTDFWNGGSGVGSAPETTVAYRAFLRRFIDHSGVTSITDVGCGDWQLGSLVDWSGVQYLGVDVVPSVIALNSAEYSSEFVTFTQIDVLNDSSLLPVSDALLIKDVLQHWPTQDCKRFLESACERYDYVIVTNDVSHTRSSPRMTNTNIKLGGWRCLNLETRPFDLRPVYKEDYPVLDEWVKRIYVFHNFRWLRP